MNTLNLEEKINKNYLISESLQIYLTCKQIELLKKYNFKYINHNIFYNKEEKIYTSIENCFSFTNQENKRIINQLNAILYQEYLLMDSTEEKKQLSIFLKKLKKE